MNSDSFGSFFHPDYGLCEPVWRDAYIIGAQNPRWGGLINIHAVVPVLSSSVRRWSMELRYPVCYRARDSFAPLADVSSFERLPGPPRLVVVSHSESPYESAAKEWLKENKDWKPSDPATVAPFHYEI